MKDSFPRVLRQLAKLNEVTISFAVENGLAGSQVLLPLSRMRPLDHPGCVAHKLPPLFYALAQFTIVASLKPNEVPRATHPRRYEKRRRKMRYWSWDSSLSVGIDRPRLVRSRNGKLFVGFTPAISPSAAKKIRQRVRDWRLNMRTSLSLKDIARFVNPIVRGWINYYGAYNRSALYPILRHIDLHLVKWVKRKYKKKGRYFKRAKAWLGKVAKYHRDLFVHWQFGAAFPAE